VRAWWRRLRGASAEPSGEAALWRRLREEGDPHAREALVRAHLHMVTVAVQGSPTLSRGGGAGRREYSCGLAGLVRAVDAYDPDAPASFAAFAAPFIDDALLQDERHMDRVPEDLRASARRMELTATRLRDMLGRPPRDAELADALGTHVRELDAVRRQVERSLLTLDPEWTHRPWEPWRAP
jgi:DNA-directed RNA polymerase specialized sigma subunit